MCYKYLLFMHLSTRHYLYALKALLYSHANVWMFVWTHDNITPTDICFYYLEFFIYLFVYKDYNILIYKLELRKYVMH